MANTKVPIELSSTPGIVDNSTATAITIDGTGAATFSGNTTVGVATAATNVEFRLNGVAAKAKRVAFASSGVDQWLIGQGAASETDAFEIYNANGQMSLSIAKATSAATFYGAVTASTGDVETGYGGKGYLVSMTNVGPKYAIRSINNTEKTLFINDSAGGFTNIKTYTDGVLRTTLDGGIFAIGQVPGVFGSAGTSIYTSGTNNGAYNGTRNGYVMALNRISTTGNIVEFYQDGGQKGNISVDGSSTAYNTSSDQRLKENIANADDAGSKIDSIQVRQYDWKADGSHQDYGMIAQELLEVAPEAVSVPEDSEEMMGVDYSKLVPMMLKEIQSLRARIAILEGA